MRRKRLFTDIIIIIIYWIACPVRAFTSQQYRHKRRPRFHSSTPTTRTSSWNEDPLDWKPNDVDRDLARLEQAINFSNRDINLVMQERREMMEYMPTCRKTIPYILVQYFWKPSILAFVSVYLMRKYTFMNRLFYGIDLGHLIAVILFPFIILQRKRILTKDSSNFDPEYRRFLTDSAFEYNPCENFTRHLTQQWASVVLVSALLLPTSIKLQAPLLRLGIAASIRQYPKLKYELIRHSQPRPLHWTTWALRGATTLLLTRWFVAIEVLQAVLPYATPFALVLSASTMTVITLGSLRVPKRFDPRKILKKRYLTTVVAAMILLQSPNPSFAALRPSISKATTNIWSTLALCLSNVAPVIHLYAFSKLVRMSFVHDLPLTSSEEDFRRDFKKRMAWRLRLEWREPRPLVVTLNRYWRKFWYWLFLSGSVEDQMSKDRKSDGYSEVKRRGLTILQQVEKESPDEERLDRSQWKEEAMKRVAKQHEDDYEKGSYEDPLGVAVHQTLGIGLGFNFDHMSKLHSLSEISTRRLQARAAKSAIKRVQDAMNAQQAKEVLEEIEHPEERKKMAKRLRKEAKAEVERLAARLSELVPTNSCPELQEDITVHQFFQTGANEYTSQPTNVEFDYPLDATELETKTEEKAEDELN